MALPSVKDLALGKLGAFVECQRSGSRQSHLVCRVPFCLALCKASINRRFAGLFALFCRPLCFILPSAYWHTVKLCRVSEKRHSAKMALPSLFLPSAICRVTHSANRSPSVKWPLPRVFWALGKLRASRSELTHVQLSNSCVLCCDHARTGTDHGASCTAGGEENIGEDGIGLQRRLEDRQALPATVFHNSPQIGE